MRPCLHPPAWRGARVLLGLLLLLAAGCPFDPAAPARCVASDNCPRGYDCVDGFCTRQDDPSTLDGATLDSGVVRLDAARVDQGAIDRDAASGDTATAPDQHVAADGPASDGGTAGDALAGDSTSLDGSSAEAGGGDAASDAGTVIDTGPLCDPGSCPASPDPCLRPTCGASGCTFTTANENTACPTGICRSGQCEARCWIDGATVEAGTRQTAGACLACQPSIDPFAYSTLADTTACDDGSWCSGSDRCSSGLCTVSDYTGDGRCGGGTPRCDEDGDRCVQCLLDTHCSGATPRCKTDTGTCVACLSPADCPDDGNVCTTTSCVSNICGVTDNSASCTDGLWCTGTDTCGAGDCTLHQYAGTGGCTGGTPYCDEANNRCVQCLSAATCPDDATVCTDKVCTVNGTCGQSNNTVSCDDTLWCNGTDTCSGGGCNTHSTANRCSGVAYRTVCNDTLNRCECGAATCPSGYLCDATSKMCRRTLTYALADSNQDGYQDPYSASTVLGVGEPYSYMSLYSNLHVGGLRYVVTGIPAGASIVSATLAVYVNKTDSALDSPDLDIAAQRVANAPAMAGNVSNELTGKTLTTASVRWLAGPLGVGWRTSPDFKNVLQELIGLPGWAAGNAVLLVLTPRLNTNFEFLQHEGNQAATLSVTYELP